MSKRGESRPWLVEYRWSTGPAGTDSYGSEDRAQLAAAEIRRAGELRPDAGVTVRVRHRTEAKRSAERAPREAPELGAMVERMLRALARRAGEGDLEALQELARLDGVLSAVTSEAGQLAHDQAGYSFTELAAALGISRQGARQRFGSPAELVAAQLGRRDKGAR